MSSFMIGLQMTGGVVAALLTAYVGWKAWGFIALFVRAVIRVFEQRTMAQQRVAVEELRADASGSGRRKRSYTRRNSSTRYPN